MAEEVLVIEDVEAAARLIGFLDEHGYPVQAALWLYQSEADRWRFVISIREKRENLSSYYGDIAKLMNQYPTAKLLSLDRVDFVDSQSSVVGPLSKVLKIDGDSRVRYTNNRINGVFLEDALIYRLAA